MARSLCLTVLGNNALLSIASAMARSRVPGTWLNPSPEDVCLWDTEVVAFRGSIGSTWLTREERAARGWADVGEPENIFLLDSPPSPTSFSANISVTINRSHGGEQAGIYLYSGARSWVKFVLEASHNGLQLTLAEQLDNVTQLVPFVRGKLPLPDELASIAFRIIVTENKTAVAEWAWEHAEFQPMVRGLGWLEKSELAPGQAHGSVTEDDPRYHDRASCQLPAFWSAALVAEQWDISQWRSTSGDAPCVQFSDIRTGDKPASNPSTIV